MRQYVLVVLSLLFFATFAHARERDNTTAEIRQTALVSWYAYGTKTANGEKYNPHALTVAHKTLPFGTIVKFTNPQNNKSVYARVNDRGPYIKGREFDLSLKCAQILGFKKDGVIRLEIQIYQRRII